MSCTKSMMASRRLTVNLPTATVNDLKALADDECVTVTELVRRALTAERFLRNTIKAGGQILILEKGKTKPTSMVVFR